MPDITQSSITVTWGRSNAITYVLGVTSAPPEYDGFQALTLADEGTGRDRQRYVLIQHQHESWQEMRYRSGLYSYERTDVLDEQELSRRLYEAMYNTLGSDRQTEAR